MRNGQAVYVLELFSKRPNGNPDRCQLIMNGFEQEGSVTLPSFYWLHFHAGQGHWKFASFLRKK